MKKRNGHHIAEHQMISMVAIVISFAALIMSLYAISLVRATDTRDGADTQDTAVIPVDIQDQIDGIRADIESGVDTETISIRVRQLQEDVANRYDQASDDAADRFEDIGDQLRQVQVQLVAGSVGAIDALQRALDDLEAMLTE